MKIIVESNLKTVRKAKGITVRELAELTGMSKTYISDVENNHKVPTIYTICLLAAVLDVSPEVLYSYKIMKE